MSSATSSGWDGGGCDCGGSRILEVIDSLAAASSHVIQGSLSHVLPRVRELQSVSEFKSLEERLKKSYRMFTIRSSLSNIYNS